MKKILYIVSLLILITACNKLEEKSNAFITSEQYYKTPDDAVSSVTGIYAQLGSDVGNGVDFGLFQRQLQLTSEKISDNEQAGPGATNPNVVSLGNVNFNAANDRVQKTWKQLYAAINRANASIDHIPGIDFGTNTDLQKRLLGEAQFLRALFYFNLVQLWGDVPLVLHETTSLNDLYPSRTTVAKVYEQIISDLTAARNALPIIAPEAGRATRGAAAGLLAKVYLTRKDWKNAITFSYELINPSNNYGYDLFPNYADIFKNTYKNQKEHIFDIQYLTNSAKTNLLGISAAPGNSGIDGAWDADVPNGVYSTEGVELYKAFKEYDKRRDVTYFTSYTTGGKTYTFPPHYHKFVDPDAGNNFTVSGINFPVIRFADILLTYAEAINEDNNGPTTIAYQAIDSVRHRAGLAGLTKNLTADQFRDSLYFERRLEFVYENQRWFDLIRRGPEYLVSELHKHGKPNAQAFHVLLPIPQGEIDKDKNLLPQNTGY